MLQDIRDNSQGVIAKVIIGLIVAVFALWGVESIIGGFVSSPSIAEVNGEEIYEQQLANNTQNLLASIGGNLDSFDQEFLEQISLSQIIEEILLRQAAEAASMKISDERIDRIILESPQFQLDGVFNTDLAVRTITSQQMNVPMYRDQLKKNMLLAQVANAYSSSNFVTNAELEQIAKLRLQTRDFRFISLTLGTRTLGEAIPDDEISTYYQSNQEQFVIEETVKVQYVELNKTAIMDEIAIDDALVVDQYNRERDAFEGLAERRASHILFEVGPARSEEQALQEAAAAKQRLDDGENFADLARVLSSDTVSADEGGDIGYSDGTAFPQPIEDALVELDVNQVSDPVVTEFGVHLVMLTEDAEVDFPAIEEVRDRIVRDLKAEEAEQIYAQRLEDMSNMAFESPDLQDITMELNLNIQESEPFPRSGGQGLFANPSVIAQAYSDDVLTAGFNSSVVEINDSQALVMRVLERNEATVKPIEEVEGEIAVILRTELERERAQVLGEEILDAVIAGRPVDEILSKNELEWVEQKGVSRDSIAVNREITDAVFSMPKPTADKPAFKGMVLTNGTYAIVELDSVNVGDIASLAEDERASILDSLLVEKSRSEFSAFLGSLRENANVTTRLVDDTF